VNNGGSDPNDFIVLYPGVYTEKKKALVEKYLADNRALEERGDIDVQALIKGTLPKDTPGLGPSYVASEAMIRYNNEEKEYEIIPAEQKRVMVVGGGPAGMETALIATLRGHRVILCDNEPKLGGSLPVPALVKGFGREDTLALASYYKTQLAKLGVDTRLGREVNRSVAEEARPDVLIIAVGGIHNIPDLPGINKPHVVTGQALHRQLKRYMRFIPPRLLRPLTKVWMPIGKRVIIMGGDIQGCQTAEFLVERGRQVTIVDTAEAIGEGLLETYIKPHLLDWLDGKGVTMLSGVQYEEITDNGLIVTTKEGERLTLEADTIVTALPLLPNTGLYESLEGSAPEVHAIGDCREPHLIVDAVADGSRIARAI
jgi:2,4-dienoyl-CoA reductase (NADPH2)